MPFFSVPGTFLLCFFVTYLVDFYFDFNCYDTSSNFMSHFYFYFYFYFSFYLSFYFYLLADPLFLLLLLLTTFPFWPVTTAFVPVPAVVILLDPADDTGLIYNLILLALLLVFEP